MARKRLSLLLGGLLMSAVPAFAVDPVKEEPVGSVGTNTVVSVSTSAWTKVPTTSSLTRRNCVKVVNDSDNSSDFFYTYSVAAPTIATTTFSGEVEPGEGPCIPAGDNVDLYFVTDGASAQSIGAQELRQ
jgi:hypothetical protein